MHLSTILSAVRTIRRLLRGSDCPIIIGAELNLLLSLLLNFSYHPFYLLLRFKLSLSRSCYNEVSSSALMEKDRA